MTSQPAGDELGPYRLLGELGRGGMGLLYEAEHVHLGRKVALKLLAPRLAADPGFRERFVRESQLLAAIEHPNIIPIYDAGQIDGVLYLAMRLVDGPDLGALIAREGPLEPYRALAILDQVGSALDAAHARELVHRDVKPANILIDEPSGRVFLTDFGIAKNWRAEAVTQTSLVVGTVDYAAPEQLQGEPATPASDVYALGGVLFEAFTGHRAYEKATEVAVIFAHALEPPPAASELRSELPPAIDRVIGTAMAKAPGDRYATCRALVAHARAALGDAQEPSGTAGGAAALSVPAPRPALPPHSGLPLPASPLVGRERELIEVGELLSDRRYRLVTLTGSAGTGKTRLALAAAHRSRHAFPGGVAFVDLAAVVEPAAFVPTLSETLGVDERAIAESGESLLEAISARLRGPRTLLLLDSFEHLLAAATIVGELLAAVPSLTLLVTSHAPLHLRHEHEYPVPPLADSDAVELFLERATAVVPDFVADSEDAVTAVHAICARLDGLPLAIELAASRVRLLSPQAILGRLENALEFLTGGARDLPARHQTLRAAIEWSYGLLEPAERVLLERLGVFSGGFTLEAAAAVCGADEPADEVATRLESLLEKSLVRRLVEPGEERRLLLLQSIQEYALYRLLENGEVGELRRRHAVYYLRLAEQAEPDLFGEEQAAWVTRLEREAGNLRAALAWALESQQLELGLRAASALSRYWSIRGHGTEGRLWLDRALRRGEEVPPRVYSRALYAAGYAALGQGDFGVAGARFDRSLTVARGAADRQGVAMALGQLGWVAAARGETARAVELSKESLSLAERLGETGTASVALANLAEVAAAQGRYDQAAQLSDECLALRRRSGDRRNIANALLNLGRIELARGRKDPAERLLDEGLAIARELGDTWSIAVGLSSLGHLALRRGDYERAAELLVESLKISSERHDRRLSAECIAALSTVAALDGDHARAARLGGAAERLRATTGAIPSPLERSVEERHPGFEAERARGAAMSFEEAVADALIRRIAS